MPFQYIIRKKVQLFEELSKAIFPHYLDSPINERKAKEYCKKLNCTDIPSNME